MHKGTEVKLKKSALSDFKNCLIKLAYTTKLSKLRYRKLRV